MSASRPPPADRSSAGPITMDLTGVETLPSVTPRIRPPAPPWAGMWRYLAAGILLGLLLVFALTLGRSSEPIAASADTVNDDIIHLHAREIGASCWEGASLGQGEPVRMTVSLEVGTDGRVTYAAAAGASSRLRSCVEAHVRSWEFLPQAQPSAMVLPVEVDRH